MYVAELDVLRDEGLAYGKNLQEAGNQVEITMAKGVSHLFMLHDAVLDQAKEYNRRCIDVLRRYVGKAEAV